MDISSKMISECQGAQQSAQNNSPGVSSSVQKRQVKWQLPEPGWYKVNVDAFVVASNSYFKVGMVFRDDKGAFMEGRTKCIQGEFQVMEAEVTGAYEALCWVEELGIRNVVVECDSLGVVNDIVKKLVFFSEIGNTLDCYRTILRQRTDLKVQHVGRQANSVAHNMAKLPCLLGIVNSMFSPPPLCVGVYCM